MVRDGRIVSVIGTGAPTKADNVIEAGGRVLLPGLFDMHGHLDPWEGGLNIAAASRPCATWATTTRRLQRMIEQERAGTLLSTRIVPAGFIEGVSDNSARADYVVANLDEAKNAVDWYAEHGYPQIKIYNSFPKDILRDTIAYAHAKGLRVSGPRTGVPARAGRRRAGL
jgi:N-acyl-D-aspartate/D-glutamate deacylase